MRGAAKKVLFKKVMAKRLPGRVIKGRKRGFNVPIAPWLCGELRQGRIGVGSAAFRDAFPETPADEPTLTLDETDRVFAQIAAVSGRGSTAERRRLLTALLARATRPEQEFLVKLVFGELRQGAR